MTKVDVDMVIVRNKNGITTSDVDLLEYDVFWKFIAAHSLCYYWQYLYVFRLHAFCPSQGRARLDDTFLACN